MIMVAPKEQGNELWSGTCRNVACEALYICLISEGRQPCERGCFTWSRVGSHTPYHPYRSGYTHTPQHRALTHTFHITSRVVHTNTSYHSSPSLRLSLQWLYSVIRSYQCRWKLWGEKKNIQQKTAVSFWENTHCKALLLHYHGNSEESIKCWSQSLKVTQFIHVLIILLLMKGILHPW